ncbi:uncharacterized protein LOC144446739 [Glandiceps talaboti]
MSSRMVTTSTTSRLSQRDSTGQVNGDDAGQIMNITDADKESTSDVLPEYKTDNELPLQSSVADVTMATCVSSNGTAQNRSMMDTTGDAVKVHVGLAEADADQVVPEVMEEDDVSEELRDNPDTATETSSVFSQDMEILDLKIESGSAESGRNVEDLRKEVAEKNTAYEEEGGSRVRIDECVYSPRDGVGRHGDEVGVGSHGDGIGRRDDLQRSDEITICLDSDELPHQTSSVENNLSMDKDDVTEKIARESELGPAYVYSESLRALSPSQEDQVVPINELRHDLVDVDYLMLRMDQPSPAGINSADDCMVGENLQNDLPDADLSLSYFVDHFENEPQEDLFLWQYDYGNVI